MSASFPGNRKRRVLYNDDSDQQYLGYGYQITDEQSFIEARTAPTFGTHVDTYVWCVGNGCEPPWGKLEQVHPCLGSGSRATDLIVEACHARDMEVWGSLRMNDIHDSLRVESLEQTNDPLKAAHPEYLIGSEANRELPRELAEHYLWTAFNFANPQVRRYRVDFIARNAAAHQFDGYELDFTRFVWNFPLGDERKYRDSMTELVRDARAALNGIAARRQRTYTFAVHVHDSPELSLGLGLNVESWLQQGLVDVLVVGMGYMPYVLRLDEWLDLGRRYGVQVYPSVNTNTYTPWWKEVFGRLEAWREAIRASSAYFWQEGADGIYLFNMFDQERHRGEGSSGDSIYGPLQQVGEPARLEGEDKIYSIQPTAQSGFCHHGSEAAPLPIALDRVERKLPLKVGPDAAAPDARLTLRVRVTGDGGGQRIWLRLNHALLPDPIREEEWYLVQLPAQLLRPGSNELSIWCDADLIGSDRPLIVHQVFLEARYGG